MTGTKFVNPNHFNLSKNKAFTKPDLINPYNILSYIFWGAWIMKLIAVQQKRMMGDDETFKMETA